MIYIGCDHGGFELKNSIIAHLTENGADVVDCGTYTTDSVDYPDIANEVCDKVLAQRGVGILVCGTGVGMSIAANKRKGIRAALCGDTFSARMTRMHNDSNILCLGQRVTGFGLANDIVDAFLNAEFEGGRHERRVNKINEIESL